MNRRLPLLAALLLAVLVQAGAQSVKAFFGSLEYAVRGGLLILYEDNGNASDPMPITFSLGGAASYAFSDLVAAEVSLDFYRYLYDYDYTLERAVSAGDNNFRSSFVFGTVLGLQPVFRFKPWGDNIRIRAYGGLAFDLRLCLLASGVDGDEDHTNANGPTGKKVSDAAADVFGYFWGSGRFIYPFVGGGMDFNVTTGMKLGFDLRVWLPVWRAWTGEDLPTLDSFRFGIGFRASFN